MEPAPESGNVPEQNPDEALPMPESDVQKTDPDKKEGSSNEMDSISEEIESSRGEANNGELWSLIAGLKSANLDYRTKGGSMAQRPWIRFSASQFQRKNSLQFISLLMWPRVLT